MKNKLLLFILLLFPIYLFAQDTDTIKVYADSINSKWLMLNDGWRFHAGDDPTWADVGFDDSEWEIVQLSLLISDTLKIDWEGIGWFRKTIKVDSALVNSAIALELYHFGASQIFMNGKLVHQFGKVSTLIDSEKVYHPHGAPVIVVLDTNSVYTFAIRYSNWNAKEKIDWYKRFSVYIGINFFIKGINNSIRDEVFDERLKFTINIGISGIFLSLSILHFFLYLFYQRKKENLFYSLTAFFVVALYISISASTLIASSFSLYTIVMLIRTSAICLIYISFLGFLYSIFYPKMPRQFYYLLFINILFIVLLVFTNLFSSNLELKIIDVLIVLSSIEGLRVIFLAIKRKQKNSWIIGAGVVLFAAQLIIIDVIYYLTTVNLDSIFYWIFLFIRLFSIPMSMSIYLARNIATTNEDLEKQLVAVKELSDREIENQKKTADLEIKAERERIEHERKTKELEEARQLQLSMLPREVPHFSNLDIAVYMKTATEVGGDYYDFHVGTDGTLTVVIGDATGHGMKAGMMVTTTKGLFNVLAPNPNIVETFHEMTRCLKIMHLEKLFMCMTMLKITGNKLQMSAAGMPPVLIYKKESQFIEEHVMKGMPLGTFSNFPYTLIESEISAGDTILMMSDGFPELMNEGKEMFGYKQAGNLFEEISEGSPEEIITKLKDAGSEWTNGNDPDDDVTFVVIKVK